MMALILKPRGRKERPSAPAPKIAHMDLSYLHVPNVLVPPQTSGDFPIAIMSTCTLRDIQTENICWARIRDDILLI